VVRYPQRERVSQDGPPWWENSLKSPSVQMHSVHLTALAAVFSAGFVSAMGQILLLRELLVLFLGNELSAGIVLTSWLLWTAVGTLAGARWTRTRQAGSISLAVGLWFHASILPASILFIRASRIIWSIPVGEMFPFGIMLSITFTATSFFCVMGGVLFGLAWNLVLGDGKHRRLRPLDVYAGEAVGWAAGGLTAHYVIMPRVDGCDAAFFIAGWMALMGIYLIRRASARRGTRQILTLIGLLMTAGWLACLLGGNLGFSSHRWHWGNGLIAVRNTPYHQLALLRDRDQYTLFGNGLWYFTLPDPQTAELTVHPVMLQHREPHKVLLMGGSGGGLVQEILKIRSVDRIDTVEPDPEVIRLLAERAGVKDLDALLSDRVRTFHADAGAFVRRAHDRYDVILLNVGEPVNADQNRFYTVEFYQRIRKLMEPDAVFAFGLSWAPDVVGEAQIRYLSSVHTTLRAVFPEVLAIPGESIRFLATPTAGNLSRDPELLSSRMRERKVETQYVQDFLLQDLMSPTRLGYMDSLLNARPDQRINTDFTPTCYFNGVLVWSSQIHPSIGKSLLSLAENFKRASPGTAVAVAFILLLLFLWSRKREERSIRLAVGIAGGSLLALEFVLLLAFQVLEGFLYAELAVILSCYMTGLAAGAASIGGRPNVVGSPGKRLITVHFVLVAFVLGVMLSLMALHRVSASIVLPLWLTPLVFRCLAFTAGGLGGIHFSLATVAWAQGQSLDTRIGAGLYAADLIGAALSGLVSSLLLLPLIGVYGTLIVFGGLLAFGGLVLIKSVNR
jgi:spermidine synthase